MAYAQLQVLYSLNEINIAVGGTSGTMFFKWILILET